MEIVYPNPKNFEVKKIQLMNSMEILSMNFPILSSSLKPSTSPLLENPNSLHFSNSQTLINPIFSLPRNTPFPKPSSKPNPTLSLPKCHQTPAPSYLDIDMVKNKQGVYTPKPTKVVVLWDLDNKPPRGPPFEAATALNDVARNLGDVVEFSAYANRHAFIHLPQWVVNERRERKQLDVLERKGIITPPQPYVCGVCGRKCKTNLDLKKHFKQLHERERQKKLNRMRSLKGKKRQKYREKYIAGNHKYNESARVLIKPKVGYGLASELRRAGVFVKTVDDKPQAADWALKRQMQHSMTRGIDWLVLVSDDSDFQDMLKKARDANLGTMVVGDSDRALGRHAGLWVPWGRVESGEITEEDLVPNRRREDEESDREDGLFSFSGYDADADGGNELDSVVNELVVESSGFGSMRISVFSEGEGEGEEEEEEDEWGEEEEVDDFLLDDSKVEGEYGHFYL